MAQQTEGVTMTEMQSLKTYQVTICDKLLQTEFTAQARETHARNGDVSFEWHRVRYLIKPDGTFMQLVQYARSAKWGPWDYFGVVSGFPVVPQSEHSAKASP